MRKPTSDWDEDYVLSLPLEDDTLELKGTRLLDLTLDGVREDLVLNELAKQLSAFANTGGGNIVYGLSDNRAVDLGGVSRTIKGRSSTKEWLEDLIPTLTDYEILGVNVYEIPPRERNSAMAPGKALYVVDVPDSDRAPHQSKRNLLYYVRLGGKSQPASHRLVEDIRNRLRHPSLELSEMEITHITIPRSELPRVVGKTSLRFRLSVRNCGRVKANNSCLYLRFGGVDIVLTEYDLATVKRRSPAESGALYWEILDPIYPDMTVTFWFSIFFRLELVNAHPQFPVFWALLGTETNAVTVGVSSTMFADNAAPRETRVTLGELGFLQRARRAIDDDAARDAIHKYYGSRIP